MENKLEQLLNSLIEKGWKPYGISRVKNAVALNHFISFSKRTILGIEFFEYTLRSMVSRESGLWQFVCENGMVDKQYGYIDELKWWKADDDEEGHDNGEERYSTEYQFWLIESSLKDESELEQFLLDNIKVDVESK